MKRLDFYGEISVGDFWKGIEDSGYGAMVKNPFSYTVNNGHKKADEKDVKKGAKGSFLDCSLWNKNGNSASFKKASAEKQKKAYRNAKADNGKIKSKAPGWKNAVLQALVLFRTAEEAHFSTAL